MVLGRRSALLCLFGSLLSANRHTLAQTVVPDNCLQIFQANGTTTVYPFTSEGNPAPPPTIVINPTPIYGPCAPEWMIIREIMTVIAMDCSQTQIKDEPLLTSRGGRVKTTCIPSTKTPPLGLTPPVPTPPRRTEVLSSKTPRLTPPVPPQKEPPGLIPPVPPPPLPLLLTNTTPRSKDPPGLTPPVPPPLKETPGLTPPVPAPPPPPTHTTSPPKETLRLTPPVPTPPAQTPRNKGDCTPTTVTLTSAPTDCPPPATVTTTATATMQIVLATRTVTVALSTITIVSTRVVSPPTSTVTATFTTVECGACRTNWRPVLIPPPPPRAPRWLSIAK